MNDTEKLKAAMIDAAILRANEAIAGDLGGIEADVDPSGTPLAPGNPKICLGSGTFSTHECCCDNCDHYLKCFPGAGRKEDSNGNKKLGRD